jgi:hypothetical protein
MIIYLPLHLYPLSFGDVPSGENVLQVLACVARAGQALSARELVHKPEYR